MHCAAPTSGVPELPTQARSGVLQVPHAASRARQFVDALAPNVRAWLDAHPRFHLHFVPTSSSWLNLVEGVFADLTKKRLRRGAFVSVDALVAAIIEYLEYRNQVPRPFVWTASVESILVKLRDCSPVPSGSPG